MAERDKLTGKGEGRMTRQGEGGTKPARRGWAPLRVVMSRPRYFSSLVLMALVFALIPPTATGLSTRLLLGWNAGLLFFVLSMFLFMYRCHGAEVPRLAAEQDVGQRFILLLTVGAAIAAFLTIAVEIRAVRHAQGLEQLLRVGLIVSTILLSWCFVQVIFALHYAHHYFVRADRKGLAFPGPERQPDYGDFLYFAFTVGSAFATSDVNITTPGLRRTVTLHTVLSFFFNTFILGLWVNIGAGLL